MRRTTVGSTPAFSLTARVACCAALLAAPGGVCRTGTARAQNPSPADRFQDEPDDALIHRLQPGGGSSALPPGLVLSRTRRWLPELRLLLIDATLTNRGKADASVEKVVVADWAFSADAGRSKTSYRNLTYRNDTWYGSTYWTGPDWTRVGRDWHHPGINTTSVRCFTAPRDGRVTIAGRVYKADLNGDGVNAAVRHGRRTLWSAEIDGKDAQGAEPKLAVELRSGDRLRFIVHKRGRIFYDTTRWDPVITYAGGTQYRASEGFSTGKQGHGAWSYEMETAPPARRGSPHVYAFGPQLELREETLHPGGSVELSGRDSLPAVVVADQSDQSGVVLAVNPSGRWQLDCRLAEDKSLHVALAAGDESSPLRLAPGESVRLPRIALGAYRGRWPEGMATLQRMLDSKSGDLGLEDFAARFAPAQGTELDLLAMVQAEWRREDKLAETAESYAAAAARHLEGTSLLLADLRQGRAHDFLAAEAGQLAQLSAEAARAGLGLAQRRSLYQRVRKLKRDVALANPLMRFGKLLFCKRVPTSYSHLVMQYFGWRARPGGGLFILERPGRSLRCRDVTGGRLAEGCVLEPRLSYDARRIVFSYVKCKETGYDPNQVGNDSQGGFYHVWEASVDGTRLRQLSDGPYDDLMPTYAPGGGIVFSSTRRRGYARCFGGQFSRRWHIYTLHRMDGDGNHLRMLSCHDTNEWFPTVGHDGRIVYARWDYIDRDAVTHQNLWAMRPDGTNPVTVWGNATSSPHCSFQAKAIPGSSKFVFTASAHHSITGGSIALVDPTVDYDSHQAITRITPEIPFPEAEGRNIREYYTSPWPLSEKYFLVGYSPAPLVWEPGANPAHALGIYLLDRFGNRELIYRDPAIGSTNPTPLVARVAPPALPGDPPSGARPTGEMVLADVYRGLGDLPRGSIKRLRIIQIFPKTTHLANNPAMGIAGEENGRAILGSVPVEADGSARFVVPALRPLLFQALDGNGFAYQTMRSATYVQPGERVACVGCHENRMTAPVSSGVLAMRREASQIEPGPLGGRPFSFVEMVQPLLDRHCVECHGGKKTEGKIDLTRTRAGAWTRSYVSLTRDAKLVPRYPQRNQVQVTPPGGVYGALGSRLMKLLGEGHEGVRLGGEEMRRLAAWIDCNAVFYGTPEPADQAQQFAGRPVPMPEIQ